VRTQRAYSRSKCLIDAFKLLCTLLFREVGGIRLLFDQATRSYPNFMRRGYRFSGLVQYCFGAFGRLKASEGEPKLDREWDYFNSPGEEDACIRRGCF
jgi:hypothetical protein